MAITSCDYWSVRSLNTSNPPTIGVNTREIKVVNGERDKLNTR